MKTTAILLALGLSFSAAVRAADCCAPELPAVAPLPADSIYRAEIGFSDDAGRPVKLAELRGRPVALAMFFSNCAYACPLTIQDMTRIREKLPGDVRDRVALVLVSFDSKRDTPEALHAFRDARKLGPQWTLLHGDDDAVRELAALLGVKFKREAGGQFAHSNLITVLSMEGAVVHQRPGLGGGVDETTAALATAAAAKP